jgi:hypothetical protein
VLAKIREVATGGPTILFVRHDMQAFSVLCNRGAQVLPYPHSAPPDASAHGVFADFSREASEAKEESALAIGAYGSVNMPTIEQPALEI